MIVNLYVIKDKVADELGPIFEAKNDAVAARNYRSVLKKAAFPTDYILLKVGRLVYTEAEKEGDPRYILLEEEVELVDMNIIEEVVENE